MIMMKKQPSTTAKSLRIVVADDEEYIRQYFSRVLPRLGHQVVGNARNGRELVDICLTEKPDLIVTDMQMPELSGLEAAEEIAKSYSIPMIIVSSHGKPNSCHPSVVAFVRKPFELDELAAAIANAV